MEGTEGRNVILCDLETMNENLLRRRTEMPRLTGKGLVLNEVFEDLAAEYGVTRTALYIDWGKRHKWIPTILALEDPQKVFYDIAVAHKEIYRMAVKEIERYVEGQGAIGDYLAKIFKEYHTEHFAYSKVIWDISAIAYLIDHRWVETEITHSPILTNQMTWSFDRSRHFIRNVTFVIRFSEICSQDSDLRTRHEAYGICNSSQCEVECWVAIVSLSETMMGYT